MITPSIETFGSEILELPSHEVLDFKDIPELIEVMFTTMYQNDGVGLAAPQIGVPLRLFVYDDRAGNRGHAINPFVHRGASKSILIEGCLSVPGLTLDGIRRSKKARLRCLDVNLNKIDIDASGLLAQIFQHEADHLEGILFFMNSIKQDTLRLLREWRIANGVS